MASHGPTPYTVDYRCPDCGTETAVNRRTGRLYNHYLPQTGQLCPASREIVLDPEDMDLPEEGEKRPA